MVLSFFCTFGSMGCLDKIVGMSRKDCECFTDDRPSDYATSVSGLYLDELDGLSQKAIATSQDCGENNIWEIMDKALQNGHKKFKTDILSALHNKYQERFPPFEGVIGQKKFNGVAPQLDVLLGMRIKSNCIKGSCLILKGIDAYFDTTVAAIQVDIYRSDCPGPFVPSFNIASEANKKKINTLSAPIELPLYVEGVEEFYYSIVYTLPVNVKPLNTKLACKCNRNAKRPWSLWIDANGIKSPAFTTVEALDDIGGTQFTYGLNLVSQIECKKGSIICEEGHVWDFENDDIALNIAHAIQEISGVKLINEILSRPDSAYFALNDEQLVQIATQNSVSYQQRIEYLSYRMKPNDDCWMCGNQSKMVGIMS